MKRRTLLATAVTAAMSSTVAVRSEQTATTVRLGVLLYSNPQADSQVESLRVGLAALGYAEGRNVVIDYRSAEGKPERLAELAADLVESKPNVLVLLGGDVAIAAINATRSIPIVFTSSADPVQLRLVASLARPGGNATGVTFLLDELAAKRMELFKQAAPSISRLGVIYNPDHVDNELRKAEEATRSLGLELHPFEVRRSAGFDCAFAGASKAGVDSLFVISSRLIVRNIDMIVRYADANRLPLAGGWGAWAQQGALLSYGPNVDEMVRRAAGYIDRIVKGAKPHDLPVQQPTTFELVLNRRTATRLGLTLPPNLLSRAEVVIE
jgi:putative ABC transport system substrate-binding protein